MRTLAVSCLFFLFAPLSSLAQQDDQIHWADVGDWVVAADPHTGLGCYIYAVFEGGTGLRLGLDNNTGGGYVIIGDEDWRSLEVDKDYDLIVQFDSEPEWTATAIGVMMGSIPMLRIDFQDAVFIEEFMRKLGMRVFYENREIASLSLRGSSAAALSMIECQETMNSVVAAPADPFADGKPTRPRPTPRQTPVGDDPFI